MKNEFTFSDKNILIVEDQKPFQVMLKGMLMNLGAGNVVICGNGEQALVRCNEVKFDVLFIDYNLGDGRNGRQLYEELKQRKLLATYNVSMLVTGESELNMVIGAIEIQPDDYIVKPFSQNLLKQRVSRAWTKKQILLPLLKPLESNDYKAALSVITTLLEQAPRLKTVLMRYNADILYKLRMLPELELFLDEVLAEKKLNWALVYKSKLMQLKNKFDLAIKYGKEALEINKLTIEAYDIIAESYLKNDEKKPAYDWIRSGIEKSPYSVQRQYRLSAIAKLNKDYDVSIKACNQVIELTSKSFHRDQKHMLNHIRNIIDICELEKDKNKKRKYNLEAIYTLQRSKQDQNANSLLRIDDFEQVCLARLDSVNGLNFQAKRSFFAVANKYTNRNMELPVNLLPDSVSLMLNIGEYDKAKEFALRAEVAIAHGELDNFALNMLDQAQQSAASHIDQVKSFNQQGIDEYQKGELHSAHNLFEQALTIAPMNTSTALNIVQVLITLIESEPKNKWRYIERCRLALRIFEGLPVSKQNEKRAEVLTSKFDTLLLESRTR